MGTSSPVSRMGLRVTGDPLYTYIFRLVPSNPSSFATYPRVVPGGVNVIPNT